MLLRFYRVGITLPILQREQQVLDKNSVLRFKPSFLLLNLCQKQNKYMEIIYFDSRTTILTEKLSINKSIKIQIDL